MVPSLSGFAVISIDLGLGAMQAGRASQYAATSRIARLLENLQISATWNLADPANSEVLDRIVTESAGHEIGVLGDSSWLKPHINRAQLLSELMRRFGGARAIRLPVSTLALHNVTFYQNLDLLVANGIRVIRPPTSKTLGKSMPYRLQCGVWQIPATAVCPHSEIPAGASRGTHVVVDANAISAKDLRNTEQFLKRISKCRDRGQLRIETLSEVGERLTEQTPTGGSILRKAA